MGKYGSVEQITTMKWYLNVLITRSTALRKCITGGDGWKPMYLDLSSLWKSGEASLSSIMYSGLSPLVSRCSCRSLKTHMNLLYDLAFMGRIKILFLLYSYITNIYLFPLFEVTGNLPVKSVDICLL